MVDEALLEWAQKLDKQQKREFAYALLDDADADEVTPVEAVTINERLADLEANPEDEMSSEEFWSRLRGPKRG